MEHLEVERVLAILVLYRRRPEESQAYVAFRNLLRDKGLSRAIDLMICDNSPVAQPPPAEFKGIYRSDISNPGLAKHYNDALQIAKELGVNWLMLFDHDTIPTQEYLEEALTQITDLRPDNDVVAIVPKLHDGKKFCSPHLKPAWSHPALPSGQSGRSEMFLYAFNSGAILRVEALQSAGGFPQDFPIEYLDYATFSELQKSGGHVYVMKSILRHELAMSSARREVPIGRYRNILLGERKFHERYGTPADRFYLRVRLLKQTLRFLVMDHRPRMAALAFRSALAPRN